MKLIRGKREHSERVLRLYQRVLLHLEQTVNYPKWTQEHPSEDSLANAIRRGELYVCIEEDEIIGAVVLSEDPEGDYGAGNWRRDLKEGEYLAVHILAVDPEAQGRGTGEYIINECTSAAQSMGYRAIRLDVVPDNTPAVRLYRKTGFVYAGTKDLKRNIETIPYFSLYELNF